MGTLHIIHTNDLHSHFENWEAIVAKITAYKKSLPAGDDLLVMDLGDHLDRSHVFTEATAGKGNVELLNEAGYHFVTIGNNEGITLSHEQLETLYSEAQFEVVLSNFFEPDGTRPEWLHPYVIHTTSFGKRIGLFGVTAAYDEYYKQLGWHVTSPLDSVKEIIQVLAPQVDLVLCLAHVGRTMEEEIAEQFPEVDLLFGAHTHHTYSDNYVWGRTHLSAGGKWGMHIGVAVIQFTETAPAITTTLHPVQPSSSDTTNSKLIERGEKLLEVSVFSNDEHLPTAWEVESKLSERLGEALITYTEADCALFPAGLLLTDLYPGEISAKMMHDLLPHPINPCIVTCTGADLIEAYRIAQNEKWPTLEVRGLGFRGKQLGKLIFANFVKTGVGYQVNGEPLETKKNYKLATVDMFTFGYFFPRFKELPKVYFMPETIRDVFIHYSASSNDSKRIK